MRKFLLLFLITFFFSCEKNNTNDILPNIDVNVVLDLNLPEYIQLKTPSNWVYVQGGLQGIVVQNTGIGNPNFKAFERACPNNDCTSPMTFDGSLKLKCSCDNSEYSIIDGSPQTAGNIHFAREYKVNQVNENTLIITNY
jgi:nitrite reductase/ring-hydroxylating ferredoxin subunit